MKSQSLRRTLRISTLGILVIANFLLGGCASTVDSQAMAARNALIAQEQPGDYWIGRRYRTKGTRFWGFVRRPGQPWDSARLVIMDESLTRQPDRLPEMPAAGEAFGYDHNREYKVWGSFTGGSAYDPNANLKVPIFRPGRFELISSHPGWLFTPGDDGSYNEARLPLKNLPPQ